VLGMLKALRTTIRHVPQKPFTIQYPEERAEMPARSRGLFKVVVDVPTGEARCRSCTLCETNCPVQVIRVNYRSRHELPAVNEARLRAARAADQPPADMTIARRAVREHFERGIGLVAMLQIVQESYNYLPRDVLEYIALETGTSLAEVYGAASFYQWFRLAPVGKHVLNVCLGTACRVAGAGQVVDALVEELGVGLGETTADGLFTIQGATCLGACALAPAVRIGDTEMIGRVTPDDARMLVRRLAAEEVGSSA
jgi:NADH-quinone oxidoreductase subunit E